MLVFIICHFLISIFIISLSEILTLENKFENTSSFKAEIFLNYFTSEFRDQCKTL